MTQAEVREFSVDRLQRSALLVGIVALAIVAIGGLFNAPQFFRSYLLAFVFCLGPALGSLGITMLHNVVGGRWGALIKRFLAAGARTLPFMAILVLPIIIPVLLGMSNLYHWTDPHVIEHDAVLAGKRSYLNVPFFTLRTLLYFAIWIGFTMLLARKTADDADPVEQNRAKTISAPGLIVFAFTVTFAGVDWIMSLEPHWFSTMYGAILLVGQALSTLAFSVLILTWLSRREPFAGLLRPEHFHDIGSLIFAFTVLWAYTSFSQFLIIWSGNIPEETPWYIRRSNNGWQIVAAILMLFHFAVPFFILLNRFIKRRAALLSRVCIFLIFMRLVDLFYWIEPAFHDKNFGFHWMDLLAPIGLGGIWLWVFLWQLKQAPLVNLHDPRLQVQGAHH